MRAIVNVASTPATSALQQAGSSRFKRTIPSLAALIYPGLIWCGPAIGPVFLAISIAVPLFGLVVAWWIDHRLYPRSRWIAFAVVGTPALYSLLGGWLDFQHVVPFKGLHVWVFVWLASAGIAYWEQPLYQPKERPQLARQRLLPFAHGVSAALITCFAAAHLANHFGGLWGGERHMAIMHMLRPLYRNPIIESVLLGCILFQLLSGLRLLQRKLPQVVQWIDVLQVGSAIYLVLFFLSHLSAVLRARYLRHIDTNWTWLTSDGLLTDPWSARLVPYYFLAVIVLAVHGGAGVRHVMLSHGRSTNSADNAFYVVVAAGAVLSGSIIIGLIRG
jgi:hypothetical protein